LLPQVHLREGVAVDRTCGILFANKPDSREARPLYYPARIAKGVDTPFARSSLWNNSRAEPVSTLLPSKSMRAVEDLSPTVQGAYKYEQLGDEAMEKLLASLLDETEGAERWCVQILDLSPGLGNLFMGYLRRKAAGVAVGPGLFYMCVCENDVHADWITKLMEREALDLYTAKKLSIAGCEATAADPPSSLLVDAPTPPSLTVLAYRPYTADETPFLKWSQHPVHGQAMKDLVDQLFVEFTPPLDRGAGPCGMPYVASACLAARLGSPSISALSSCWCC
jgi:hypothetical protein